MKKQNTKAMPEKIVSINVKTIDQDFGSFDTVNINRDHVTLYNEQITKNVSVIITRPKMFTSGNCIVNSFISYAGKIYGVNKNYKNMMYEIIDGKQKKTFSLLPFLKDEYNKGRKQAEKISNGLYFINPIHYAYLDHFIILYLDRKESNLDTENTETQFNECAFECKAMQDYAHENKFSKTEKGSYKIPYEMSGQDRINMITLDVYASKKSKGKFVMDIIENAKYKKLIQANNKGRK